MSLAIRNDAGNLPAQSGGRSGAAAAASAQMTIDDVWQMAVYIAESKLFPVANPQQAFSLMMIAQSEGIHPMQAMRRYHLMTVGGQTRPAMRSDAMQALFQADGGRIKVVERSDARACARFFHPVHQPDWIELEFTMKDAVTGGVAGTNPNYKKWPAAMLWARLMTMSIRTVHPGINVGILSDIEAQDLDLESRPPAAHARADADAVRALRAADTPLPGDPPGGYDARPYTAAVKDVAAHCGAPERDLHNHLWLRAAQHDRVDTARPKTLGAAVARLARLYETDRGWCRDELAAFAESRRPGGGEVEAAVATEEETQDDGEIPDEAYPPDEPGSGG